MFLEFLKDRQPDIILEPNETLFYYKQTADCAYVVQKGEVELFLGEDIIGAVGEDDMVGEMALFETGHRLATAQAGERGAVLYRLDNDVFMSMIGADPAFAFNVMQRVTSRLDAMNKRTLQYKYTVGSMKDGVMIIDQQGIITSLNHAAMDILGFESPADVENHELSEILGMFGNEINADFISALDSALRRGEYAEGKVVRFIRGFRPSTLSLTTSELYSSEEESVHGVVAVFRDISELSHLRDKEAKLSEELKRRHDELMKAYVSIEENSAELESTLKRVGSMRRWGIAVIVAVLALVGALSLFESTHRKETARTTEMERAQLVRMPVTIKPVSTLGPLPGALSPLKILPVKSEVNAKIERVNFVAGQLVAEGYNLARLEMSDLKDDLNKASGEYVSAVDNLNQAISKNDKSAQDKAEKDLTAAKSQLENIESTIRRNIVRATANGSVIIPSHHARITEGDRVEAGEVLVQIVDMSPVLFYLTVDSGNFGKIHVGQKATVISPSFRNMALDAEVAAFSPREEEPNTYEVAVVAKNLDPEQRASFDPAGSLEATVEIYDRPAAITAPISSVIYENGVAKIKIWDKRLGQVRLVSAQTGVTSLDAVEILSGLGPEDEVVIE
ncbi:MAG: efflux RND transporter periplasmic adaptor subunit [Nitrospinota bacterium]|nr:efflux RND transporter periplasmic adaptor subunit [Nitrospinota bacterium]